MGNGRLTICQISDIHCGNSRFIPELLDRTIIEINRANPRVVVLAGDLTDAGYREEFAQAAEYIARIECENVMVIPGNHDARNVGYIHFERLFGERQSIMDHDDVILAAVDSSEPDLNDGQVGREPYGFIEKAFSDARDKLKVFVVHHHLIPLPGTGRERNIIFDAGDVLERLVEAEEGQVEVYRKYPFKERELAVRFDRKTREYSRSERKIGAEFSGHPQH